MLGYNYIIIFFLLGKNKPYSCLPLHEMGFSSSVFPDLEKKKKKGKKQLELYRRKIIRIKYEEFSSIT